MGDDKKERALGKIDAAYMTVVPLWARYMYEAAHSYPNPTIPWRRAARGQVRRSRRPLEGLDGPQMELIWHTPEKKRKGDEEKRPPV